VSSTNRAPRRTQPGEPGEERTLRLHLKLLADVGLLGFPNAGKSTLISHISAARPKIADYPFTTLVPNLGVVTMSGERSFVVADVPGLIAGAHAGHGLGDRFLKHIERTKVLIHLVDVSGSSGRDPVDDFDTIMEELRLFSPAVAAKPQIVAANKIDALDDPARLERLERHVRALELPFHRISGATGEGIPVLLEAAWRQIAAVRAAAAEELVAAPEP
jgi:GTP-binding protein